MGKDMEKEVSWSSGGIQGPERMVISKNLNVFSNPVNSH